MFGDVEGFEALQGGGERGRKREGEGWVGWPVSLREDGDGEVDVGGGFGGRGGGDGGGVRPHYVGGKLHVFEHEFEFRGETGSTLCSWLIFTLNQSRGSRSGVSEGKRRGKRDEPSFSFNNMLLSASNDADLLSSKRFARSRL